MIFTENTKLVAPPSPSTYRSRVHQNAYFPYLTVMTVSFSFVTFFSLLVSSALLSVIFLATPSVLYAVRDCVLRRRSRLKLKRSVAVIGRSKHQSVKSGRGGERQLKERKVRKYPPASSNTSRYPPMRHCVDNTNQAVVTQLPGETISFSLSLSLALYNGYDERCLSRNLRTIARPRPP